MTGNISTRVQPRSTNSVLLSVTERLPWSTRLMKICSNLTWLIVIAHPGLADSVSGIFVVSTKRSTSSTEALLAFAVLTRDRKAA